MMVVSTYMGRKRTNLLIALSYFIYIYIHTYASQLLPVHHHNAFRYCLLQGQVSQ